MFILQLMSVYMYMYPNKVNKNVLIGNWYVFVTTYCQFVTLLPL